MNKKMFRPGLVFFCLFLTGCLCQQKDELGFSSSVWNDSLDLAGRFQLDKEAALADLKEFTKSPHIFGSDEQKALAEYLKKRAENSGLVVTVDQFSAEVPNPELVEESSIGPVPYMVLKTGFNIYGYLELNPESECLMVFASHFDTKRLKGINYLGANDSGSSSILLLQLMAHLKASKNSNKGFQCNVMAVWFDGEEAFLEGWDDGERVHPAKVKDNTYGSRYLAGLLRECSLFSQKLNCWPDEPKKRAIVALILLDMVGGQSLRLTLEGNSSNILVKMLEKASRLLKKEEALDAMSRNNFISDDHLPFLQRGVPAIDIINFSDLTYWHKEGDEIDKISLDNIELAGKMSLLTSLPAIFAPKVFLENVDQ